MDYQSLSELVFGRIIDGREDLRMYNPDWFVSPYNKAVRVLQEGGDKTDVAKIIAPTALHAAVQAAQTMNGAGGGIDWAKLLRRGYGFERAAQTMEKTVRKIRKDGEADVIEVQDTVRELADPENTGLRKGTDIEGWQDYTELIPSGWDALDYNLGGIPHSAPIIMAGEKGVGKSFWSMRFKERFLKKYSEKTCAVYSLEMPVEQYLQREERMYKVGDNHRERTFYSDKASTIDDIAVEVAAMKDCGLVICDYIDYLVKEGSEDAYARIYKKTNEICRTLKIPFLMLAQPNRNQYTDPIPRPYHIRYSGMAENVASQVIMLWNPKDAFATSDDYEETERKTGFIYEEDSFYLLCWKNRAGWQTAENAPDGKARPGPGAIILPKTNNLWSTEKGTWQVYGSTPKPLKKEKRK